MDRNSILPAAMFTSPPVSRCNCEVNENLLSTKYDTFSFLHCSVLSRTVIAVNNMNSVSLNLVYKCLILNILCCSLDDSLVLLQKLLLQ